MSSVPIPLSPNDIPVSPGYQPNVGVVPLRAGPSSADTAGQTTAPLATSSQCGTAALSNVGASTSSVSILAANTNRIGLLLYNDSSSAMYLAYAATATTSAFTVKIPANALFEMPHPIYTGALSALWDAAIGTARITEES